MEEENKGEQIDQGLSIQPPEGSQEPGTVETAVGRGEPTKSSIINVLGRDYDLSKPEQVLELSKDYDRLGRMYSPLTQRVTELEENLKGFEKEPEEKGESDPETIEYLRKLGFVHNEELSQKEEDKQLEIAIQGLEKSYDGKDGRPKFDRRAVLEFCVQSGISNPEYGYWLLNRNALKEWDLRQAKSAPTAPPSSGGEGGPREPQPKKRVFGPAKEGEVGVREAMLETLEKETPSMSA